MLQPAPRVLLASATLALAALAQSPPCYETNLGTNLNLPDDSVAQGRALGFAFPFAGGSVTSIDISSNGFVWLASSSANGCCNGDAQQLLAGLPRIAPLWLDLNPPAGVGVFFNTFPGRAVVTWEQVPEYGWSTPLSAQLQLLANGSFQMSWGGVLAVGGHVTLAGFSAGGGAANPGPTDLSGALPVDTGTAPTCYEVFGANTIDVAGLVVTCTPNGRGGYLVAARQGCNIATYRTYGVGCPAGATAYELFPNGAIDVGNRAFEFTPNGTGYDVTACTANCIVPGYATGTNLNLTDDAVARNVALGFPFPAASGATSAVDVSSNGCIYLRPGTIAGHRCCAGDPVLLVSETANIALLWQDLNPGAGGAVRTHQPGPGSFAITWVAVPEFGQTNANTAQVVLFADGRFRLAYGTVANQNHACLIGYSPGGGVRDPGSIDFTAAVPFGTGSDGTPVQLYAALGSRPALGTTFQVVVGWAPVGTVGGLFVQGLGQTAGIDLRSIGMPGCRQWVTTDVVSPFVVQGTFSQLAVAIPNIPALLGLSVFQQAALLAPGINALGAVVSNGAEMVLGP